MDWNRHPRGPSGITERRARPVFGGGLHSPSDDVEAIGSDPDPEVSASASAAADPGETPRSSARGPRDLERPSEEARLDSVALAAAPAPPTRSSLRMPAFAFAVDLNLPKP